MSTRLLTEMSGSTDILCSSFQSQSAHFLFFLHRVPEIRDTGAEWPKNLPKHSGSDKKPRIFGIQILFGIDAYNSAGLPPVSSSLRISQVFILLKKSPSQRTITSSSSSSRGVSDTLARFAFFLSCCTSASSWDSSTFLFRDGAGSSTTIKSSSFSPEKRTRLN